MSATVTPLTLQVLKDAFARNAAAIRRRTTLFPAGGSGNKVFPPTYLGGEYAKEQRKVRNDEQAQQNGEVKERESWTVLLDSVQSQANRMELALLRGYREGKLRFPLLTADFTRRCPNGEKAEVVEEQNSFVKDVGKISALEAPHRIADAIFRDSLVLESDPAEIKPFRHEDPAKSSKLGQRFEQGRPSNATALFELCPTALIFGVWDSTGPRGGLGTKFAGALVSEIVGYDIVPFEGSGRRPGGRLDPLGCVDMPIYRADQSTDTLYGVWTPDADRAMKKDGRARLFKRKRDAKGKTTEVGHSNIPPSLADQEGNAYPGGFTISAAVQTTVLSLAGLRRLCFPVDGKTPAEQAAINRAAHVTLAALALAAITWQDRDGYDLRSRCLLDGRPGDFEVLAQGESEWHSLGAEEAACLLKDAAAEASALGLSWQAEERFLFPAQNLRDLVVKSREKTLAGEAD
jgi:CRISPR-associated protein Csb1